MKPPRIGWYWHVLIAVVLLVMMSAVAIWFGLGHSVHSMTDIAASRPRP